MNVSYPMLLWELSARHCTAAKLLKPCAMAAEGASCWQV